MQRRDIRAVGDLAGEASSVVTRLVRGMHAGIAGRVFDSIGPSAAPTRVIHDGLTRSIYGGVDRGIRGATHAAGAVAAEIWGDDGDVALEKFAASIATISPSCLNTEKLIEEPRHSVRSTAVVGRDMSHAFEFDALGTR